MRNVNRTKPGLFDRSVVSINSMLERTEEVCKELWQDSCEECRLRSQDEAEGVIMCGYPERINSTRENNCRYKVCPLIHK